MTTLPRTGATELVASQAVPETAVNEMGRHLDAGHSRVIIEDRDLTAPPGTCDDGACYLVDATATGDWAGKDGNLAIAVGANAANGWIFQTVAVEGFRLYVRDENIEVQHDGSSWNTVTTTGASTTQTAEQISGFIASPDDKSYTLAVKMAHGGTVTETTTISASGTCTATFKVNSTALGGTANSVSSAEDSQSHASSNTFSAGDDIVLTVSSNSSCADMSFTIKYTRTLS